MCLLSTRALIQAHKCSCAWRNWVSSLGKHSSYTTEGGKFMNRSELGGKDQRQIEGASLVVRSRIRCLQIIVTRMSEWVSDFAYDALRRWLFTRQPHGHEQTNKRRKLRAIGRKCQRDGETRCSCKVFSFQIRWHERVHKEWWLGEVLHLGHLTRRISQSHLYGLFYQISILSSFHD